MNPTFHWNHVEQSVDADTKPPKLQQGSCLLRRGPSGAWTVEGSSVPLPAAAVQRSIGYAETQGIQVGDTLKLPLSVDSFSDWCKSVDAEKDALGRLPATALVRVMKAACEMDDDQTIKDICSDIRKSISKALGTYFVTSASVSKSHRAPRALSPGSYNWAKKVLLEMPAAVASKTIREAAAGLLQSQGYQHGHLNALLPVLARLPQQLHTAAIRACAPSIDSKLAWPISLSSQDFSLCQSRICSSLSSLNLLTSISFRLSSQPGATGPLEPLTSPSSRSLHIIAMAICKLPHLSSLSTDLRRVPGPCLDGFLAALSSARHLESLQLLCHELQEQSADKMKASLKQLRNLRNFALTVNSPLPAAAEHALSSCLGAMTTVRGLFIAHPCSSAASAALVLSSCTFLQLRTMTLRYNFTGDAALEEQAAMEEVASSDEHDAAENGGTAPTSAAASDEALARAIGGITSLQDLAIFTNAPVPGFGQHLLHNCTRLTALQRLRISGALQASCGEAFGQFLQGLTLQELQVSGTPGHPASAGVPAVGQRLCMVPAYQYAAQLPRMAHLTSLDLSDTSAAALCAGWTFTLLLQQVTSLWCLKLVNWSGQDAAGEASIRGFAAAIAHLPSLGELHVSGGTLAACLTPLFRGMKSLQKVVMYGRIPWVMEPQPGCCTYADLATLKDVRLIGNGSTQKELYGLVSVVGGMPDLEVLILSYQTVEYGIAFLLSEAMLPTVADENTAKRPRENRCGLKRLQVLGLGGCGMSAASLTALAPALQFLAKKRLRQLMLWGNDADAAVHVSLSLLEKHPELVIDGDEV